MRLYTFVLFLALSASAQSQSYHFRNFGLGEGLLSGYVESVVEDSLGFIWLSGESGLTRYDGSTFEHYFSEVGDSTTLMNKSTANMRVDKDGWLWVGMLQGGIARYRPDTDDFKNYAFATTAEGQVPIGSTYFFSSNEQERLVIRTVDHQTFKYNESLDAFESFSLWDEIDSDPSFKPIPVFYDSESRYWLSLYQDGLRYLVSTQGKEISDKPLKVRIDGHINCVFEAPKGVLWVGTWGGGLYRHVISSNSTSHYFPSQNPDSLPGSVIEDIEQDGEGNLWVATESGVAIISHEQVRNHPNELTFERPVGSLRGVTSNINVKEIECDTGGRLWFATWGGGIFLHDPRSISYDFVSIPNAETGRPFILKSIFQVEDSLGRQWYALKDSVFRYNPSSEERVLIDLDNNEKPEGGLKPIVNLAYTPMGDIMVGFQGGDFTVIDQTTFKQSFYPNESNDVVPRGVIKTYKDSHGATWVSTYQGILRHRGTELTEFDTVVPSFDGREILEDEDGNIWIGSWNEGVVRIDPVTLEYKKYDPTTSSNTGLKGTDARRLTYTRDGRLWTLTSKGLNVYNPETDRFEFLDPSANNDLLLTNFFTADLEGNYWFSSLKGLYHWKEKTKETMFLDYDYGLPRTEFYEIKMALDGNIYVATGLGCLRLNRSKIPEPDIPGTVLFTSLVYENEEGRTRESLLGKESFRISYRENYINIDFSPLSYDLSGKVTFEYKLEGGSSRWIALEGESEVSFLGLSQGDYNLKVRGKNDWDEYGPVSMISFSVSPPWWYSKAAIGSYVIILILCIILYNRYRTHKLRVRQRKLELIVEERTEEISVERDRSEKLLLNILPSEVAEELKHHGQAQAKKIDQVTVLFTDFKGFTKYSEHVSPENLVEDLHESFTAFDQIMINYGVEKIKTIGDAYMAAGGLPTPNETHAKDVLAAAFDMRDFIEKGKAKKIKNGLPYFEIRIGVHTGPVVAGIVGVNKFSYDIWGDTVNTASRMESSGEEGKVNISRSSYELVKDLPAYSFEARGKINAKGKGELEMFFVERKG